MHDNLIMQNFPLYGICSADSRNTSTTVVLFRVVFLHAVKVSEILRQQLVAATFDEETQ